MRGVFFCLMGPGLLDITTNRFAALRLPVKEGLDETVDIAIQDLVGIPDFVPGPQVLDHSVGLKNIGANLVAPRNVLFGALEFVELFLGV